MGGGEAMSLPIDDARIQQSLSAMRGSIADLDREIDRYLEGKLRERTHLVSVVWELKQILDEPLVDLEREHEIDVERLKAGVTPPRVAVLKAIREATRPLGYERGDG